MTTERITITARKRTNIDVVSRQVFEKRWGKGSARDLPANCFIRAGGRRKFIAAVAYVQGAQQSEGMSDGD